MPQTTYALYQLGGPILRVSTAPIAPRTADEVSCACSALLYATFQTCGAVDAVRHSSCGVLVMAHERC